MTSISNISCNKCLKTFPSKSQLERHQNNKKKCDYIKDDNYKAFKCELCNLSFNYKSLLDSHNKSKKHINIENQYNIDMSTNINIENQYNNNINVNLTVINGFSETNIDILQSGDIEHLLLYEDDI